MGQDPLLLSFIVVIIGGLGSLRGTVVAAVLIGLSRRHHLDVLLADPGQDHRHAAGRHGAGVPPARPVRDGIAMSEASPAKAYALHLGVIALLFVLSFVLPEYYHGLLARIMVLAVFAMGYNMLFGYVGLLSLGHAMFFAAGLYGAGLAIIQLGWSVPAAFAAGIACGALLRW